MRHHNARPALLLAALILLGLALAGCGRRAEAGGQALAEIRSAAQGIIDGAAPAAAPARAIIRLTDPAAVALGLDPAELPPPHITPAQWVADPLGSEEIAMDIAANLLELLAQVPWLAWAAAAGMAVLGAAKVMLPGWAGLAADLAYRVIAARPDRQRDAAAHAMYAGGQQLLATIATQPTLRAVLLDHVDEQHIDIALAALAEAARLNPPAQGPAA
jgi:hypothetical protein